MSGFLGKNKLAVHPDVEHAATPFGEFRVHGISVLQLRGQTGRVGKVVSNAAIENIDGHAPLLGLRFRANLKTGFTPALPTILPKASGRFKARGRTSLGAPGQPTSPERVRQ